MPSQLEAYLEQVAAHLGPMPVKQRNEELREMRQHLLNAVTVNRELGQSEEDAAQNAVMQFGTAADLGDNLVWAWQRERAQNSRSLMGAAFTTALVVCLMFFLMDQRWFGLLLDRTLPRTFLLFLGRHPGYGMDFTQALFMITFGLAGLTAGSLFPKRAMTGICLGLALFWIGFAAADGIGELRELVSMDGLTHQGRGGWIISAITFAWAGSRWRTLRAERSRLTPG